jgi:Na+-translocating ferredoxin:NAD+ oxidoreductase subunit B
MNDQVYYRLREVLDTIPNGFPATESGVEIKLLKKIFTGEEAELAMKLKLNFESVEDIAKRTGLDRDYLGRMLREMNRKGQVFGINFGGTAVYKLLPFVFGIYEFQLPRIDREFTELFEQYTEEAFGKEFFSRTPALMKVVPIGVEVTPDTTIEPYESVAKLIEGAKSWMVNECICKKEKALMGHRCDRPIEVCLAFAPVEHVFDKVKTGRAITREEAYRILKQSEEAGLVHMTSNTATGHIYICNCCKCCCLPLGSFTRISMNATARSNYVAVVDRDRCTACGICVDRCQVDAIEVGDHAIIGECIGCGLCSTTCPAEAITMVRRDPGKQPSVPKTELDWFEERARSRGKGDGYKRML